MTVYDVIVIGAGVTGSAVARELSRRQGRFLVVERASDVCEGHQQGQFRNRTRWVRRRTRHLKSQNERAGQPADGPDRRRAGRALLPGGRLCGVPAGGGAAQAGGAVPAGPEKRRARPGAPHRGRGQGLRAQPHRRGVRRPVGPHLRHRVSLCPHPGPGGERRQKRGGVLLRYRRHRAGTDPRGLAGKNKPGRLCRPGGGERRRGLRRRGAQLGVRRKALHHPPERGVLPAGQDRRGPRGPHHLPAAGQIRQGRAGIPHHPREPAGGSPPLWTTPTGRTPPPPPRASPI